VARPLNAGLRAKGATGPRESFDTYKSYQWDSRLNRWPAVAQYLWDMSSGALRGAHLCHHLLGFVLKSSVWTGVQINIASKA